LPPQLTARKHETTTAITTVNFLNIQPPHLELLEH
jgi:hypothetical protein